MMTNTNKTAENQTTRKSRLAGSWAKDYVTIPAWAIGEQRDLAAVITALCLAGFEGQWVRLDADTQRAMMGKAYFGKREIKATPSKLYVCRRVCYGTDFDMTELDSEEWGKMVQRGYIC